MTAPRVALIGFGEVGQALAQGLRANIVSSIVVWDRLLVDPTSAPSRALTQDASLTAAKSMAEAVLDATLVISAVTAGQCLQAATEASRSIGRDCTYLDLNSVSPATKCEAGRVVQRTGAHFVEAAVMSPIAPQGIASPILLGGPHAAACASQVRNLGFVGVDVFSPTLGRASAAKMCRSVIIKGLEALLTESLLAARHHGVEKSVLRSLDDLLPGHDWPLLARYMISRSLLHGTRRAEEMREVSSTLRQANIDPHMSMATVERQSWAARHRSALGTTELEELLDAVNDLSGRTA